MKLRIVQIPFQRLRVGRVYLFRPIFPVVRPTIDFPRRQEVSLATLLQKKPSVYRLYSGHNLVS